MRSAHLSALVLCLAAVGAQRAGAEAGSSAAGRPNVLIVMSDDQGLGDFSINGNPVVKTPNLDAFAREAIRLTDFHVAPMCSPTRGQLLTGLAALRNGATSVTAGRTFLRPGIPTLPALFARAGYRTGLFGKWHLGDSYPHRPIDKGFQESVYHLGWGQLASTPEFDWPLIDGRYFHNGVEGRYKGHCTDFWFDSAIAWIKDCKRRNEPFVCYLPTNAAHGPCIDLDEYVEPYKGRGPAGFFGMIAHLDKRFGDLRRFLSEEGLEDDTIVIFMTDNGGTAGVRLFNAGLRGAKTTYYEGGHRVPCWIRWPHGGLGAPREIAVPTQNTDLLPTLCDLCGVAPPRRGAGDAPYCGVDLAPLLRGAQSSLPERTFVVQFGQVPAKFDCCVVRGRWRLVGGKELYDVEADRAQRTDLAARRPDVVSALRTDYERWWKGLEPILDEFVPISIEAGAQPVVELTSGDWEGIYADNSGHVREAVGGPTGGHWNIRVEESGTYEFTLRRWPERAGVALGGRYEPSPRSPASRPDLKTVSFPTIARARVEIAGKTASAAADPKATAATLKVDLPAGRTRLKAWFADAEGQGLCGAFFVTVRRQDKPIGTPTPTRP
jgi:arylsulfatase A-like enzyme